MFIGNLKFDGTLNIMSYNKPRKVLLLHVTLHGLAVQAWNNNVKQGIQFRHIRELLIIV